MNQAINQLLGGKEPYVEMFALQLVHIMQQNTQLWSQIGDFSTADFYITC